MLSRVAETLYWMARNIERAENNSRIIAARLGRLPESWDTADTVETAGPESLLPEMRIADAAQRETAAGLAADVGVEGEWEDLLEICASFSEYRSKHPVLEAGAIVTYLTVSGDNVNSILNCVANARNNARSARDALPHELWEALNEMYWIVRQADGEGVVLSDFHAFLQSVKQGSFTMQGVIDSLMPRGVSYLFLQIGKWLERAEKTARILNVVCINATKPGEWPHSRQYYHWLTALELVGGYDAFLRQYPPYMNPQDVLAFLIADPAFPRSIRYCVDHVIRGIDRLDEEGVSLYSGELNEALTRLNGLFGEVRIGDWPLDDLELFLDRVQDNCNTIGALLTAKLQSGGLAGTEATMCIQE